VAGYSLFRGNGAMGQSGSIPSGVVFWVNLFALALREEIWL